MGVIDIICITVLISIFFIGAGVLFYLKDYFLGASVTILGVSLLVVILLTRCYKLTQFEGVVKANWHYYKVIPENEYKQMEIDRIKETMKESE